MAIANIQTATNYMVKYGHKLIDNGYSIIPIAHATKKPILSNWQALKGTTNEQVSTWAKQYPTAGIGILTYNAPAIVIDVDNPVFVKKMVNYIKKNFQGEKLLQRIGNEPKTLFVFGSDSPFKNTSSKKYTDKKTNKQQIRILGEENFFVAYGIIPETGKEYQWHNANTKYREVKNSLV